MARWDADRAALSAVPPDASAAMVLDLSRLRQNYRAMRAASAPAETAAVVKADAYGLGAAAVVSALAAEGCITFFVATLPEAADVRKLAPAARIYVLDGLFPGTAPEFKATGAQPVLGSVEEAEDWARFCQSAGGRLPAAIHIDTGMNRLGLSVSEVAAVSATAGTFDVSCIMSHLACADEPSHPMNAAQLARFTELAVTFPSAPKSLANSAGIALGPGFHFDLTRPGIALYRDAVSIYGKIAQVRWADAGDTVGYGATQICRRPTRIATVCAGYADGYPRALSPTGRQPGGEGFIGGWRVPVLGRVSMDLTAFDVTEVPRDLVHRGACIELAGPNVALEALASAAGTIGYEILTGLGSRFYKVYV